MPRRNNTGKKARKSQLTTDDPEVVLNTIDRFSAHSLWVEIESVERLVLSIISDVPVGICLCTESNFDLWAKQSPAKFLVKRNSVNSARLTFNAKNREYISIVLVNDSDSIAQTALDFAFVPAPKTAESETNIRLRKNGDELSL